LISQNADILPSEPVVDSLKLYKQIKFIFNLITLPGQAFIAQLFVCACVKMYVHM